MTLFVSYQITGTFKVQADGLGAPVLVHESWTVELFPDGVLFAATGGRSIEIFDLQRGEIALRLKPPSMSGDWDRVSGPFWSPDGGSVAYALSRATGDNFDHTSTLFVLSLSTSVETEIATSNSIIGTISWSPTGERIAFNNFDHELHVYAVGGLGTSWQSTSRYSSGIAWSPEGDELALEQGIGELVFVDADGTDEWQSGRIVGRVCRKAWQP